MWERRRTPRDAHEAQSPDQEEQNASMKTVKVVAAVIEHEGKVLATQRGYGEFEGGWEFPGGKVEPGETPEQALVREIHEELDAAIEVERFIVTVEHDYADFHLSMRCYLCRHADDKLRLLEHEAARWVDARDIDSLDWLPADLKVVAALKEQGLVGGMDEQPAAQSQAGSQPQDR